MVAGMLVPGIDSDFCLDLPSVKAPDGERTLIWYGVEQKCLTFENDGGQSWNLCCPHAAASPITFHVFKPSFGILFTRGVDSDFCLSCRECLEAVHPPQRGSSPAFVSSSPRRCILDKISSLATTWVASGVILVAARTSIMSGSF